MLKAIGEFFGFNLSGHPEIEFAGDYDFFIDVRINRPLPFHTASVTIRAFSSSTKETPIPIRVKWFREVEGKYFYIPDASGTTYNANPYDIGLKVRASVCNINGISDGTAFVDIGPFVLDPCVRPYIEDSLLAAKGSFRFSLESFDGVVMHDCSDFGNQIDFDRFTMQIKFDDSFQDFATKTIDLTTPGAVRVKCTSSDPRAIKLLLKKEFGNQLTSNLNHDSSFVKKKEANQIWSDMLDLSGEEDGAEQAIKDDLMNSQFVSRDNQNEEEHEMLCLEIRMESSILRDAFVTSLRLMLVYRSIPLERALYKSEIIIRSELFPLYNEDSSIEYQVGLFELQSFREVLKRMLLANKNLHNEGDGIIDSINTIRNDITSVLEEFERIKEVMEDSPNEEKAKLRRIERNLVDTSFNLSKMHDESLLARDLPINPNRNIDANRARKLEEELEAKVKFNKMLTKEIEDTRLKKVSQNPYVKRAEGPVPSTPFDAPTGEQRGEESNPFDETYDKAPFEARVESSNIIKSLIEDSQKYYDDLVVTLERIAEGEDPEEIFEVGEAVFSLSGQDSLENVSLESLEKQAANLRKQIDSLLEGSLLGQVNEPDEKNFMSFGIDIGQSNLENAFNTEDQALVEIEILSSQKQTIEEEIHSIDKRIEDMNKDIKKHYQTGPSDLELKESINKLEELKSQNQNLKETAFLKTKKNQKAENQIDTKLVKPEVRQESILEVKTKAKNNNEVNPENKEELQREIKHNIKSEVTQKTQKKVKPFEDERVKEEVKLLSNELEPVVTEEAQQEIQIEVKEEVQDQLEPVVTEEAQQEIQIEVKEEAQQEIQIEVKEEVQQKAKEEVKIEVNEVAQHDVAQEVKPEFHPETKPEATLRVKPQLSEEQVDQVAEVEVEFEHNEQEETGDEVSLPQYQDQETEVVEQELKPEKPVPNAEPIYENEEAAPVQEDPKNIEISDSNDLKNADDGNCGEAS